jgi:hypothetical protein
VPRRFDKPLARQPVKRAADRRHARMMLVRENGRIPPAAGGERSASQLFLYGRVDALEGARAAITSQGRSGDRKCWLTPPDCTF